METSTILIMKQSGKCCSTGLPLNLCKSIAIVELDYYAEWAFPTHTNLLYPNRKLAVAYIGDNACNKQTGALLTEIKYAVEIDASGRIIYHEVSKLKSCRDDIAPNPQVILRRECADFLLDAYHTISKMNQYLDSNEKFIMYRDTAEHERIKKICIKMEQYQIDLVNNKLNENRR